MFKLSKVLIFFGIFLSCVVSTKKLACAKISLVDDEKQQESISAKANQYNQLLKANYYTNLGKASKAFASFNAVFSTRPSIYVYEPFLKLLFEIGDMKKIIDIYFKKTAVFEKKFKNNLDFWIVIAQSLLIANQDKEAGKIFANLAQNFPDNEQVAYYHTMSMLKNDNPDKALSYLNECLKKPGFKQKYFLFYFLRSKIYLQKNRPELAFKDIEKSLELFPLFDRGLLIKAMLMEQQGKINEAIKGYMQFLNLAGRDEMVEKQIIQLLFNQKRYDEAAKYLKKLKGETAEYYFSLALMESNSDRLSQALKSINTCLKKAPTMPPARLLKIEILLSMRDYKQILKMMDEWLAQKPLDNSAINTLLLLRKTPIEAKNIISTLEKALTKNNDDIGILSALADTYIEQNRPEKGLSFYKKVHDLTTNQELKSRVLFQMAYVHFINKQTDQAEDVLCKALNTFPVFPQSCNMLAYIYADRNKNLNKALEIIDKALESDKYSPSYLDTKGFIFLKMGKYSQALELFERASTISPGDSDIMKHITDAKSLITSQTTEKQK